MLFEYSVVIPTLGRSEITETIKSVNENSIPPNEIIIVLPKKKTIQLDTNFDNLRIINSKTRGQVMQRLEGFKLANSEYILQLDDDVTLDKFCVEKKLNSSLFNLSLILSLGLLLEDLSLFKIIKSNSFKDE